jgi:hypothetical protein
VAADALDRPHRLDRHCRTSFRCRACTDSAEIGPSTAPGPPELATASRQCRDADHAPPDQLCAAARIVTNARIVREKLGVHNYRRGKRRKLKDAQSMTMSSRTFGPRTGGRANGAVEQARVFQLCSVDARE